MKTKVHAMTIMSLLFIGLFAMSFAIAQDVDDTLEEVSEIELETEETAEADEIQNELKEVYENKRKIFGLTKVTKAFGWISQEDKAHRFDAIWVTVRIPGASNETDVEESIRKKSFGRLKVANRKFKLVKKEFTNESLSFYVLSIDQKLSTDNVEDLDSLAIGILKVSPGNTSPMQTWDGALEITDNAEEHGGVWDVKAGSYTKILKNVNKRSFWRRLAFWKGENKDSETDDESNDSQRLKAIDMKKINAKVRKIRAEKIEQLKQVQD